MFWVHCLKFKAEFRSIECIYFIPSIDGMELHREKYSEDFIPYKCRNCSKVMKSWENFNWARLAFFFSTIAECANLTTTLQTHVKMANSHLLTQCSTKFSICKLAENAPLNGPANYQEYFT